MALQKSEVDYGKLSLPFQGLIDRNAMKIVLVCSCYQVRARTKNVFSVEDVVISYHGGNNQTRLGTVINGIMESNLRYTSDKDVILQWIQHGADEPEYNKKIAPILNRGCILCHTPSINPSLPDLAHYATVAEVAHGVAQQYLR
jgi:hypothetical protein